jgi:hypothetical protein
MDVLTALGFMVSENGDDALVMVCRRIHEINGVVQALARICGYQKCSRRRTVVFPSINLPESAKRATNYGMGKVEPAWKIKYTGKISVGAV